MSIYLNEKNPEKHKPFDDASQDIVEYVRYLEVIAGKSPHTAFNYYCDLRNFSRFMKRRRGLVPADSEMQDIDPKGLDTAFWASVMLQWSVETVWISPVASAFHRTSLSSFLRRGGAHTYFAPSKSGLEYRLSSISW